jgi:MYXO-CTERM domain-containing protein
MHTARALLTVAATLTVLPLLAADALACSPEYAPPGLRFVTTGEVAQSAQLVVEYTGDGGQEYPLVLEDASGAQITVTAQSSTGFINDDVYGYGRRVVYAPDTPLAPGAYTFKVDGEVPEWLDEREFETEAAIVVTADLPPEGAPSAPSLSWRALMHDGPEDPDLSLGPNDDVYACGWGSSRDTSTATIWFDADVPPQDTPGYIDLTLEDASGQAIETLSSPASGSPKFERSISRYEDSPFVQCVSATFTDIYGRTSEPARSCQPDQCVARNKNDRDPVDWADVTGCQDWSPGYAERNAPGCACAQAPGAPSGSPAALALGLLGLVGLRTRRRNV